MQTKRADILVCIPCYNSEDTIVEVVRPLLDNTDADILLVDDVSDEPLADYIRLRFPLDQDRITVVRSRDKVYTGGGKNIGIAHALKNTYRVLILMDSDIKTPKKFGRRITQYFHDHPGQVVVGAAILPFGKGCQYADTLINFSNYLPDHAQAVSWKPCLAGYAFALNLDVFRRSPCQFPVRVAGDDVVFFRRLQLNFDIDAFPLLNDVTVVHKPPRQTLARVTTAQHRYARAFFTHNDQGRQYLFNKLPPLHLLTPRFFLMLLRLFRKKRYADVTLAPLCWFLDITRAAKIVKLHSENHRDADGAELARRSQAQALLRSVAGEV